MTVSDDRPDTTQGKARGEHEKTMNSLAIKACPKRGSPSKATNSVPACAGGGAPAGVGAGVGAFLVGAVPVLCNIIQHAPPLLEAAIRAPSTLAPLLVGQQGSLFCVQCSVSYFPVPRLAYFPTTPSSPVESELA